MLKQQLNRIQILYKEWFFPATEKQLVIYEPDWNYKNCSSNNFDKSTVYSIHIFLPQQLSIYSADSFYNFLLMIFGKFTQFIRSDSLID